MSARRNSAGGLAYLTTAYPNVSHTFIRREILELERRGYSIVRVAIRPGEAVVDPVDQAESDATLHLLGQPGAWILAQILRGLVQAHFRVLSAVALTFRLSRASDRGIFRHLAYLFEALALLAWFRSRAVAHVHVHFGTNAAAVALLVSCMGGPGFSMTIHGPDEFDAAYGFSLGRKLKAARFTVAISNFCASQLRRWVPYPEWQKIHVVGCTVGEDWFDAGRPVDSGADTVVSVGRLSAQKGQLLLIDALAAAVASGFRGRLVLVGDGEMRPAIEQRIEGLGLGDRVLITGCCTGRDVRDHLLKARALVLPSFAEGLPVVIMESMALQRPVLCTYVGGIPELVVAGEHGWLVPAGDGEALAAALVDLDRTSLEKLRAMGEAAAVAVRRRHHVETEVAKLDELFRAHAGLRPARSVA